MDEERGGSEVEWPCGEEEDRRRFHHSFEMDKKL